jgi:hypothetical protein
VVEAPRSPGFHARGIRQTAVSLEKPVAEQLGRFVVNIDVAQPTAEELSDENLVKIVLLQCTDEEVNMLAWKCLGEGADIRPPTRAVLLMRLVNIWPTE